MIVSNTTSDRAIATASSGDVILRAATTADFAGVRETIAASMREAFRAFMPPLERAGYLRHWCTPERFAREIGDPRQVHVVAEQGGHVVGIGSAEDRVTYAEMWRLYVRPEAWRRGIGHRVWDELTVWARSRGLARIHLESFADAAPSQRFYRGIGCAPDRLRVATLFDGSTLRVRLREYVAGL